MRSTIFGVGQMGKCIASAMEKLGHELTIVDSSADSLSECGEILVNFSKHNFGLFGVFPLGCCGYESIW